PAYACRVNAQLVHPSESHLVKPNELESALARPLHVSMQEPHRPAAFLAASLLHAIITAKPFSAGNENTGPEYLRAMGIPGLADEGKVGAVYSGVATRASQHLKSIGGSQIADRGCTE
ncbi:hypothetical protein FISHEDRAFT_42250, partial [Fistulina hepatica ATCC 64428]